MKNKTDKPIRGEKKTPKTTTKGNTTPKKKTSTKKLITSITEAEKDAILANTELGKKAYKLYMQEKEIIDSTPEEPIPSRFSIRKFITDPKDDIQSEKVLIKWNTKQNEKQESIEKHNISVDGHRVDTLEFQELINELSQIADFIPIVPHKYRNSELVKTLMSEEEKAIHFIDCIQPALKPKKSKKTTQQPKSKKQIRKEKLIAIFSTFKKPLTKKFWETFKFNKKIKQMNQQEGLSSGKPLRTNKDIKETKEPVIAK